MSALHIEFEPVEYDVQGTLDFEGSARLDPAPGTLQTMWEILRGESLDNAAIPIDRHRIRDVEKWAYRFGQAAVDVYYGLRPLSQLVRWTTPRVYNQLRRTSRRRPAPFPRVISTHAQVRGDIAEVALHLRHGDHGVAAAARFTQRDDHWVCAAFDLPRPTGWPGQI